MTAKILALFNLKPGTSVEDYENWAKTVDIPTVNGLGSIEKFEVFKSTGLLFSDEKPPYQYFETLDILDMDQFGAEASTEAMQKIAAEFQGMVDGLVFYPNGTALMGRFSGKTAVITGSGRRGGLGEAIAKQLAKDGANIVISDIGQSRDAATGAEHIGSSDEMESIAEEMRSLGVESSTFVCDVRSLESVRKLASHAKDTHGSLDIWINNAGIGYIMKPLLEVTEEDWRAVIDVNLSGSFYGVKSAAEVMVAQGSGGRIINIASQAAKSGFPHAQAYTSSKHGLVGLVRSAATELGPHKITINNVCPNHVTTGLGAWQNEYFAEVTGAASIEDYMKAMTARIPMGRSGLPEDTANAVAFLCSDEAQYITAESMNVSGGEEPH